MDIDQSAAIVTGGASGLGRATVQRLQARGARVVVIDLPSADPAQIESLGAGIEFVGADIRDSAAVADAVGRATALGPVRVLVNCAGVGDPARVLTDSCHPVDLERFARLVEINLVGTFNVIRLAAAAMAQTEPVNGERGIIAMTGSIAAYDGQIGQASYAASKGGLTSMTLPLARELASEQIRVVTIAPGMFRTPILDGLSDEVKRSLASQVPHPSRLGEPDEFAALVEHVIDNPMLNGETIRLDGAIRMAPR